MILDFLFGVEGEKKGDDATNELKRLAFDNYTRGRITLEQYQATIARLDQNLSDSKNSDKFIADAFIEGAKSGADNIANFTQKSTDSLFSFSWKTIPWQVKVIGAVVLFFWLRSWYKSLTPARNEF